MNARDLKRWYHAHGIPYEEEDWGPRDVTGESIGPQIQPAERLGQKRASARDSSPGGLWWWEKQAFPWRDRTEGDQAWVDKLDDFFAPYLATLPRAKGNLLLSTYGDLMTYTEVARAEHLRSRGSAHEAVERAVRDLTRLIANDDPLFRPPADGRRRDYEEESRAARRVLMVYLDRRSHDEV